MYNKQQNDKQKANENKQAKNLKEDNQHAAYNSLRGRHYRELCTPGLKATKDKKKRQEDKKEQDKSRYTSLNTLESNALKNRRMEELCAKHGIECINDTEAMQGKISIVFMSNPKKKGNATSDSYDYYDDSAETKLRYINQMKSRHPSRKNKK